MGVTIYEQPQQPVIDLDTGTVVYVPGYALRGPSEPTLVNATTFTAIFGDSPYIFKNNQSSTNVKNATFAGRPEKGWLYAKGLVDAGLTVLYHRCNPLNIGTAQTITNFTLHKGGTSTTIPNKTFSAKAKNFGRYYENLSIKVTVPTVLTGITTISVLNGLADNSPVLESHVVSLNPAKNNYIGNISFTYVDFFTGIGDSESLGFDGLGLDAWYSDSDNAKADLYITATTSPIGLKIPTQLTKAVAGETTTTPQVIPDEFTVEAFEKLLDNASSPFMDCLDTDKYPTVTYITTGGYYQSTTAAANLQTLAWRIKSMALVDLPDTISTDSFTGFQSRLLALSSDTMAKAKSAAFIGADTYVASGYRVVMPDSYGYLLKLAANLSQAIPAWIPVANNPQGVVSAVATTRPIDRATRLAVETNLGPTINPIIYKQNVGYCIMGNRTLYPNDGVLGPQSFLNCQLVVNTVERVARRAASDLLIVSTSANSAFSEFKMAVSKTCNKLLVNGDGLSSFSIVKLKKTQPATMDIAILLTVVEGIEVFNINLSYALQLD